MVEVILVVLGGGRCDNIDGHGDGGGELSGSESNV